MKISITVIGPETTLDFCCLAHLSEKPEDLRLEEHFYLSCNQSVPQKEHYELELIETGQWIPLIRPALHIHRSALNGKEFVCFPGKLPTIEEAIELFKVWCVGTTYTLLKGEDFGYLLGKGDFPSFFELMNRDHWISVSEIRLE